MKKKLVKRPLLAYASGMKGDVYGYDWGDFWATLWDCSDEILIFAGAATGTALVASTPGVRWLATASCGAGTIAAYKQAYECVM